MYSKHATLAASGSMTVAKADTPSLPVDFRHYVGVQGAGSFDVTAMLTPGGAPVTLASGVTEGVTALPEFAGYQEITVTEVGAASGGTVVLTGRS